MKKFILPSVFILMLLGCSHAQAAYFLGNDNTTVYDNVTGLIWQRVGGERRNWWDAWTYCNNLTLAGYYSWRLPSIDELKGIVNTSYMPTIDPVFACRSFYYWSGSTFAPSGLRVARGLLRWLRRLGR